MPSQSYSAIDFAYTLFLFTKDDIKTTIVPVTVLAAASSLTSLAHLPRVIFWTWLHLLQINLANQIINPEEDRLNKSSRPIVSDKITLYNAQILRWMSIPICLAVSMHYSSLLFYVSLTLATMTIIYNELGGHLNWIARGILLSIGYALFEIGACSLAGSNPGDLGHLALISVIASAGVYLTTQQALDFKDIEGDRSSGRKTLPIAAPVLARPTLMAIMCIWSIALSVVWDMDIITASLFNALGWVAGGRFLLLRSVADDRKSCSFYHLWLSAIHILPAYWRFIISI